MKLEQRKNNRVVLSVPVRYKIFKIENLEKDVLDRTLGFQAEIQDLSQGGVQVVSEKSFRDGDVLELRLDLPGQGPVQTVAKVIWCEAGLDGPKREYRSGVRFIPVDEDDLKKLNDYFSKEKRP